MTLLLLGCFQQIDAEKSKTPGGGDGGGDDTTEDPTGSSAVVSETSTETSDRDGYVEIPVEIDEGGVIQVTLTPTGRTLAGFEYVYDPDGNLVLDWEDWWDSKESLTECFYPVDTVSTLNWPVRASDGPLQAGTWTIVGTTLDAQWNYEGQVDVGVEVMRRAEPDPAKGTLRALIAYADGVDDDAEVVTAVEGAVEYWVELYAQVGVTLEPTFVSTSIDPEMPGAYEGQEEITALLEDQAERTVLLLVGEDIDGSQWVYGEAAAIPGPYSPSPITVVEVSWLANAGGNGTFNQSEILLMGETMAHEVGHFLGLFHPVEDGYYSGWEWYDALDDTEACTSTTGCERDLGKNLMFPYPICSSAQSCDRQDEITDDQGGVLNHYMGVE